MTENAEKRAELIEHLAELRTRLVRSVIYVAVGMVAAWFLYDWLFALLTKPMIGVMRGLKSQFLLTTFAEPFMIRMQTSLIAGLILVSPLVTMEIWGFVAPGLTANEKRPLKWVVPLAVVLFASGVCLCYAIMPKAFEWFASYIPKNSKMLPSMQQSVLFATKFLLAFGLAFELPVMLMLLAKIGLVNSRMLKTNWRYSMVAVSGAAAMLTPSNDAFSMLCMAIPMAGLYLGSIFLVQLVEADGDPLLGGIGQRLGALVRGRRGKL